MSDNHMNYVKAAHPADKALIAKGAKAKKPLVIVSGADVKKSKTWQTKRKAASITNKGITDAIARGINTDYGRMTKGYMDAAFYIKQSNLNKFFLQALKAAFLIRDVIPGVVTSLFRPSGTHEVGAVDFAPRLASPMHSALEEGIPLWYVPYIWEPLIKLKPKFKTLGVQVFVEWNHFHIHHEWAARNLVSWPEGYRAPTGILNVMDQAKMSSVVSILRDRGVINYYSRSFED
jgi:hypothetical protein